MHKNDTKQRTYPFVLIKLKKKIMSSWNEKDVSMHIFNPFIRPIKLPYFDRK